ncbi:MAG TPA: symmetrical bis(5'-nucleosyl)-tetraphosphatase [Cellvibrionaceae bacterium]
MAVYAVGDIQGCFDSLRRLLDRAHFEPSRDQLWVAGDLVNRGPDSLGALRFIKNLGSSARMVLGNHDLHLLAVRHGLRVMNKKDTLKPILAAADCDELLHWLRQQPLMHEGMGHVMCHAGIPPVWSQEQALNYACEVGRVLKGDNYVELLASMYGNQPNSWRADLAGMDRLRVIINYFTRMRFCTQQGQLDLDTKEGLGAAPKGFAPWFNWRGEHLNRPVLFGHWAALNGVTREPRAIALDTGCVWGKQLSMLRLDDGVWFRVKSELA